MSTTLEPDFLLACIRMSEFKRRLTLGVTAGLLALALRGRDFTAAELPGELTQGSRHVAGACTGRLVAMGLLVVVDRVKSPDKRAKGRRLDVFRAAQGKRSTILTWFEENGLPTPVVREQQEMAIG